MKCEHIFDVCEWEVIHKGEDDKSGWKVYEKSVGVKVYCRKCLEVRPLEDEQSSSRSVS